jgi:hypothetical protein
VKVLALCVLAACGSGSTSAATPVTNQTTTAESPPAPTVTIGEPSGPCTRSSRAQPLPPSEQRHVEDWAARGVVILEGYVTRLCACADDACMQHVGGEYRRWSSDYLKPLTPPQRYEAWMLYCKQSSNLMERYLQCAESKMTP